MSEEFPKVYKCSCGAEYPLTHPWVLAHWHIEIVGTCMRCGRKNTLLAGKVIRSVIKKAKKTGEML